MNSNRPFCNLCNSNDIKQITTPGKKHLFKCQQCKLVFKWPLPTKNAQLSQVEKHYAEADPHQSVASAKNKFFIKLLDFLERQSTSNKKSLLDAGCGYGYLMKMAAERGWNTYGVEIMEDGCNYISQTLNLPVFKGELTEAGFSPESYDVVTLIDVLPICPDPLQTLQVAYNILKKNGLLVIRLRNYYFQYLISLLYQLGKRLFHKLEILNPSVFHFYSFTPLTIKRMLLKAGFKDIKIKNSYLTIGDPYLVIKGSFLANIAKSKVYFFSQLIYYFSFGKVVIGPSILALAKKHNNEKKN